MREELKQESLEEKSLFLCSSDAHSIAFSGFKSSIGRYGSGRLIGECGKGV